MSPSLPPQESFESVFSLQGPVEPDHRNHITSSFSVIDMNDISPRNLDIYATRSYKRPSRKSTAHWQPEFYNKNMACSSLAGIDGDLGHPALLPTYQESHAFPGASSRVLTNSRVVNRLGDSSNRPSTATKKPPTSIYSHSLLEPIYVPVIRLPDNWSDYQENRSIGRCPSEQDSA